MGLMSHLSDMKYA